MSDTEIIEAARDSCSDCGTLVLIISANGREEKYDWSRKRVLVPVTKVGAKQSLLPNGNFTAVRYHGYLPHACSARKSG